MLPISIFTKEFRKFILFYEYFIHRVINIFIYRPKFIILPMSCKHFQHLRLGNSILYKSIFNKFTVLETLARGCIRSHACQKSNLTVKSEDVLSKSNRENYLKLLSSSNSGQFFTSKSLKKAAVLVPLCEYNNQLALLYTVRALHLKVNGGEIAFPGGRFDESDGTLENTALREAHEEVGINPKKVDIWGKGPEIHRPDIRVTPVLGYIGQLHLENLKINPDEVSFAFIATLEQLSSSENFCVTRFRTGKAYVFQTPVYLTKSKRIWGLTAYITHIVLSCLIPKTYKNNIKFKPKIQKVLNDHEGIVNERKLTCIK